ncbi:hypothetical protein U0E10_17370 [Burkholderia ubonensis]|uniref:hypothetical protein n=1 Tax=Burkholderia ubonensis TaxID=101571 RepID=UPI002AB53DDC|nr:hypothetical protein [Burkholderia ubonensis]MDY7789675.1 hypothetical protein [Burkholderia ubonensis]
MKDAVANRLRGATQSRTRFKRALGEIRASIPPSRYQDLIAKARRIYNRAGNGLIPGRPQNWQSLRAGGLTNRIGVEHEIYWVALQLVPVSARLEAHLESVSKLSALFNVGLYDAALEVIDEHLKMHGPSLWNLEANIACLSKIAPNSNILPDLMAQLSDEGAGLVWYVGHKFCDLYEQNSTLAGFVKRAQPEIDSFEDTPDLCNYLRVKLLGDHISPEAVSDFLRRESVFSYIDAFEGVLVALYGLAKWPEFSAESTILHHALGTLATIPSASIKALGKALGYSPGSGAAPQPLISSPRPRFDAVTLRCLHRLFPDGTLFRKSDAGPMSLTEQQIETETLRILTGQTSAMQSLYNLRTFAAKHQFLPWATALDAWLQGLVVSDVAERGFARWVAAYGEPERGYESEVEAMDAAYPWLQLYEPASREYALYKTAVELTRDERYEEALGLLNDFLRTSDQLNLGLQILRVSIAERAFDESVALRASVDVVLRWPGFAEVLPFDSLIGNERSWSDLQDFDLLDLAIGLHYTSRGERESKTKFNLELVCKKLLAHFHCESLAELLERMPAEDRRVSFILWRVMVPKNLRLVGFLKTSDAVDTARLQVCQALLDVVGTNKDEIVAEIRRITEGKFARKVELEIETARIFADKDGIRRWAERECREQFLRLKTSRVAQLAPSLAQIKASLTEARYGSGNSSDSIEQHMKDPLFALGASIFSECFWKQDDGLDHFLSLRIRHGSLSGYLRAPLERGRLVSQGTFAGSVLETEWKTALKASTTESVNQLLNHLTLFQEQFDASLETLRKEYVQIRSKDKPKGIFAVGMTMPAWDVYYHQWEGAETFEQFFEICWAAFEDVLDVSLEDVRVFLTGEFTQGCEKLFDTLRRALDQCGLDAQDRANLVTCINDSARGLQDAVAVVANWFVPFEPLRDEVELRFEQVLEVALRVFKNARPGFSLDVEQHGDSYGDVLISSQLLPRMSDALFIIFDNVYRHSGHVSGAKVKIIWAWTFELGNRVMLNMRVENTIAGTKSVEAVREGFAEARAKISSERSGDALVGEGGTGLVKLVRIAQSDSGQFRGGRVAFDVSSDGVVSIECALTFPINTLRMVELTDES